MNKWFHASVFLTSLLLLAVIFSNASSGKSDEGITVKVSAAEDGISVSVKSSKACELQFYMFNMEGQLVNQSGIKGNTIVKIPRLLKGTYMYDVFHDDAKLKSGKIELK